MRQIGWAMGMVAAAMLSAQAMGALTLIQDDFEANAVNASPPSNSGIIGTWVEGTQLAVVSDYSVTPAGVSGWFSDREDAFYAPGVIQSAVKVTTPGQAIHAEIYYRHGQDGFSGFGITTDVSQVDVEFQKEHALLWLNFQDTTGSYSLHLQAMDSNGDLLDVAGDFQLHCADNPFPEGQFFDKIEFDYIVGDSTGILTVNGQVLSTSVPLRNPGGVVDGMFFMSNSPNPVPNTRYYIDNLLMTTPVPEPGVAGLAGVGLGVFLGRRQRGREG